jgi:hypothetical protein
MNEFTHIVFNHVPKCGGSSLRYMFYEACIKNDYFIKNPMYIPLCTHNNICLQEKPEFIEIIHENTKIFFDHSRSYFFEQKFNLNIENTYRILNIRNPIERFISHLYFFDRLFPNQCSYETLKSKTKEYGNCVLHYLIYYIYGQQKLDEETKYNIAKEELKKYNFIFNLNKFKQSISEFNLNNPFNLVLEEKHINNSTIPKIDISKKTLLNIKHLIQYEILLLKDFYEDINQY